MENKLEQAETSGGVSLPDQSTGLALLILSQRLRSLTQEDRDDLLDLVAALRDMTAQDEIDAIAVAMQEILDNKPVATRPMPLPEDVPADGALWKWTTYVGGKIKEVRDRLNLTQADLAEKAGLTQSHISRIENGTYSPTNKTLVKIAGALGIGIGELDPSSN